MNKKVLVTGATGYVAGVLIEQLLDKGLTVHATVRDPTDTDRLKYLTDLAAASKGGSLHFFKGDLTDMGSFAEAMKGVSIVFHTASPFILKKEVDGWNELVEPAVMGVENVLLEANKTPTVERVVLTSSNSAIGVHGTVCQKMPGKKFTESIWNRVSDIESEPYYLSKTLAEQKAWEIAGGQTQWKLVVMNPSFVLGPGVIYHSSSQSHSFFKLMVNGTSKSGVPAISVGVVDVRDVAAAHIAGAYLPDAKGRHLLCGTNTNFGEIACAPFEKYGAEYPLPAKPLYVPNFLLYILAPYVGLSRSLVWTNHNTPLNFDSTKAKEELGMEFYSLKKTTEDMMQQFIDNGIAKKK